MSRGVSNENKRLGMSVQETYDKLDQLDRLKVAYENERTERIALESAINKSIDRIVTTSVTYNRVGMAGETLCDKLEFLSKSAGLLEAAIIIREALADAKKGD